MRTPNSASNSPYIGPRQPPSLSADKPLNKDPGSQISPGEFLRDVRELDLEGYDRVVSDFEPVTAWAARGQRRDCIGLGHQYALVPGVPRSRRHLVGSVVLRACAPVGTRIGLHWHHFGHPLLPPIVDDDARPADVPARASARPP